MRPDANIAFIAAVTWFALTSIAVIGTSYALKFARRANRREQSPQ